MLFADPMRALARCFFAVLAASRALHRGRFVLPYLAREELQLRTLQMSPRISARCISKRFRFLGALSLLFSLVTFSAFSELDALQSPSTTVAGDTPADVPPLAKDLSPKFKRSDVRKALRKVADWQLDRARPNFNKDWTYAALYAGFMAVPASVAGSRYQRAMLEMGKNFAWQLGPRLAHADDEAIGQTYMQLYLEHHDPPMMAPTRQSFDTVMEMPDDPAKPLWWWCDALFMAPPVLAELSNATGDRRYLTFLDREWSITSGKLYDPEQHLFYRDSSFLDKHEPNGKNIFWSRGNGWVMAGLVRVLEYMPKDDPLRPKYIRQLQQMAAAIAPLQSSDGLWRPGLLDAEAYPLPENSGSAFITYALAYGVREHLLDRKRYLPVVKKAWVGLLSHIYEDGRLGCIQPIGAAPGAFTPTSSYVYGVGAFLLAGSEVYKLAN
jgi:unsaturated rhamnogalacturonyl hydrolase